MACLPDDLEQVGPVAQATVVAERCPKPDALTAQVLPDQLRCEGELLAERDGRCLRQHRLDVAADRAVVHILEDDVAIGVLLDVEQLRSGERLECVEGVQERAPADEERAGRLELLVQAGEQGDATPGRLRVEGAVVLWHVGPEKAGEPFTDRGGFSVIADEQGRHRPPSLVVLSDDLITYVHRASSNQVQAFRPCRLSAHPTRRRASVHSRHSSI